ncbi:MAG TPA: selenocysteine-specific translation elongation factor [Pyrinomonadaceae bacterium]|nr:selenocysteine-specific translation elongation factor [Pyrinomonadaceae bacterium]
MEVIVGTAGHIDHGKTALVKALTGIDADRLPEEKRRGITVDLGFAEISIGDTHFGFVDVPGHERFVKNMLAGASGIDIVILVVAANEGVMPQTREHFDICRLLGIKNGLIALTKTDLVDAETLDLAHLDVGDLVANSFLENAPIISVSAQTGDGIDHLKDELDRISKSLPLRDDRLVARLPIDRSFSVKGFGAVVTGTLASGEITEGTEMDLFPAGRKVRVRGLQTHGRAARSVKAGQRVAVNLGGIDHSEITRGMSLAESGTLLVTQIIDVEIDVLQSAARPMRSRQRVRVHIGTTEELARIQILNETGELTPGQKGFAQIRLENPIVAVPGERFIIRSYSPSVTIAGGLVIDAYALKHRKKEFGGVRQMLAALLDTGENDAARVTLILNSMVNTGLSFEDLQARTGLKSAKLREVVVGAISSGSIVDAGGRFIDPTAFEKLLRSSEEAVQDFHKREPLSKGMPREALRKRIFAFIREEIFEAVISTLETEGKIVVEKETVRSASYRTEFSPSETALNEKIIQIFEHAGLEVPRLDDALAAAVSGTEFTAIQARKFFQRFLDRGEIVKVTDEFYFSRDAIDKVVAAVRAFADGTSDRLIDVSQFKEIAGVSRKYAIPLLEYFDRAKVTRRAADKRVVL